MNDRDSQCTQRPWTVADYTKDGQGYIRILGPNMETVCDIFPFAAKGGVGLETARQNAILITILANGRPAEEDTAASPPLAGMQREA